MVSYLQASRRKLSHVLRWLLPYVHSLYAALGLLLCLAFTLGMLGLWGFLELAEEVGEGETSKFDAAVLQWLNHNDNAFLDSMAIEVTAVGNTFVVLILVVVVASLLWALGKRWEAYLVVVTVAGAI